MKREQLKRAAFTVILLLLAACGRPALRIDFEKYTLDNGLEVILHEDRSDPIVSVAIVYHVGSNREEPGRTGFAHLFEHILFQESENVGQDQFFKYIQGAGGTLNGFTFEDGTGYFEIVPKNALEMVLWMESDRMGFLLGTLTQAAFENQQDVVQNEKRQRVDNQPYGHTSYVIDKTLYPEDHPYNWQVIGSLDDLRKASLQDVIDFHKTWYGPNNATLVIAGDYDRGQTRQWVEKYFGEIESSPPVTDPDPWLVTLDETKKVYHEDNFAKSPELNMVFPTVQEYHLDAYALSLLAQLLTDGKKAPFYKVIVDEQKLAPTVSGRQGSNEIAGVIGFRIRTFPEVNLTEVERAIHESFERFETESFTDQDLARIKAKTETNFYNGISSILGKSFQLAFYSEYTGSPDFIVQDIQNYLDVTKEDVLRVYETYIKDQPYVLTSFVPKGKKDQVAQGSTRFPVVEEPIMAQAAEKKQAAAEGEVQRTPSSFDRSVQPPFGADPTLALPKIWHHRYGSGLTVSGIRHSELPLVRFSVTLSGGLLLDTPDKVGVANLITDMLMEGTRNRTPLELEEAIDDLGASISMFTGRERIVIQANCLASKFDEVYALVEEIILEPRWDQKEFDRIIKKTAEQIHRNKANPAVISRNVFNKLLYGDGHILSNSTLGTSESVGRITIDDLKTYYAKTFSPAVAYVSIVGNIGQRDAVKKFNSLAEKWGTKEVNFPDMPPTPTIDKSTLYFVDVPGAKQSQIRIGYLALSYTDPEFHPAVVMNYKLGGSFNGVLNLILREEKGFTYGARSGFSGTRYPGAFTASAAVKSNTTYESLVIFKEELEKYTQGISEEDLTFTQDALIKSNARFFETLGNLLFMLNTIARYDLPDDYVKDHERNIQTMTLERHKELAQKYLPADGMVYLVVGDAATQLEPLRQLGLGEPIVLEVE